MPNLDHTGPEGKGSKTGRKLGKCSTFSKLEQLILLGKGMGEKRHSGNGGGKGKGKRLKYNLKKDSK